MFIVLFSIAWLLAVRWLITELKDDYLPPYL
jgi:hypothetical protein